MRYWKIHRDINAEYGDYTILAAESVEKVSNNVVVADGIVIYIGAVCYFDDEPEEITIEEAIRIINDTYVSSAFLRAIDV